LIANLLQLPLLLLLLQHRHSSHALAVPVTIISSSKSRLLLVLNIDIVGYWQRVAVLNMRQRCIINTHCTLHMRIKLTSTTSIKPMVRPYLVTNVARETFGLVRGVKGKVELVRMGLVSE
jgi:hypothetical protein